MKKTMITTAKQYVIHLTCTLFVALGLVGLTASASQAATGAFSFSAATYAVGEGAGTVSITIKRVGGSTGAATVNWRTNSVTATYAKDYGDFTWTALSFAAGETQKVRTIKIVNDTLIESAETFKISLASPTNGTTLGTISSAVVTINDNDTIAADATAPSVSLTSPVSGMSYSSAQTVAVAVSASDNIGVTKVELYDGTTLVGTDATAPYAFSLGISVPSNGTHSLTAKAYDAAGNTKVSVAAVIAVNIPVADLTAPTVSLSSPASAATVTSAQTMTIAASAADNIGVSKVEFYDGATLKGSDTTAPYSFAWAITSAANGSHSLTAKAYDAAGNSKVSSATVVTVNIAAPVVTAGPLKVFPGAEGFGTESVAGRGGQVIKVTNLNDSGAGSLRAALQASGPRIIVFEVSGYINLNSQISISNPYVTVAGQSAPSPGITLRNWGVTIKSHDVLIQHLAIRPGNPANVTDGLEILGPSSNVVIDHCSITWGIDENTSTWYDNVTNFTFSNNLIAEGLMSHSMGLLLGAGFDKASVVRNVFAHNNDRNPRIQAGISHDASLLLINNLIYNHSWDCSSIGSVYGFVYPVHLNMINNVALNGVQTRANEAMWGFDSSVPAGSSLYTKGDAHYAYGSTNPAGQIYSGSISIKTAPDLDVSGYTVLPPADVKATLLLSAGSRPADRDPTDQRILDSISNMNGMWITSLAEVGGYTALAANFRAFNVPANPNGDDDGDGYTNIEEVLHQMSVQVAVK